MGIDDIERLNAHGDNERETFNLQLPTPDSQLSTPRVDHACQRGVIYATKGGEAGGGWTAETAG